MPRRFVVFCSVLIACALMCYARADSDTSDWTDDDTATENQADSFYNANIFDAAERFSRLVLDRHPNSVTALLDHVKALNALGRYDQALTECRKAVSLEPKSGPAYKWLGLTLVLSHHYDEANDAFLKSIIRDPSDLTPMIWLSGLKYLQGEKEVANSLLDVQITTGDPKYHAENAAIIADFFRQVGYGPEAITWWKKAYALGDPNAAGNLEWAYNGLTPGFPYDPGESSYWQRRTGDDPYPWFPRLAQADAIVAWAHGWGIVFILLGAVVILPWLCVGIVAFFPARGLINEPTFPWMERARRAYPFMVLLSFAVLLMPVLDWFYAFNTPGSVLPMPKWIFLFLITVAGFWASNAVVVYWAHFYRTDAGTAWQNMKDIGVSVFLRATAVFIFIVAGLSLPSQFGWRAALTLAVAIAVYFYTQFGGWVQIARLIRVIVPAGPDLVEDATDLARQHNLPAPTVWLLRWRKGNAFALPFSNAILVTPKLRDILTRAELKSVLAHEIAHLCEDRGTRLLRLIVPLMLLPMFTVALWGTSFILLAFCGYVVFLISVVIMRKRARRMEERADSFGKAAESEAGVYPLALAKLYEANLIPAVMPGKSKVHPHLYDRLLAAGITPDYPRPKPPGRWGLAAGFLIIALHAACLWVLWLCLF